MIQENENLIQNLNRELDENLNNERERPNERSEIHKENFENHIFDEINFKQKNQVTFKNEIEERRIDGEQNNLKFKKSSKRQLTNNFFRNSNTNSKDELKQVQENSVKKSSALKIPNKEAKANDDLNKDSSKNIILGEKKVMNLIEVDQKKQEKE